MSPMTTSSKSAPTTVLMNVQLIIRRTVHSVTVSSCYFLTNSLENVQPEIVSFAGATHDITFDQLKDGVFEFLLKDHEGDTI